jgi:xanthine/uracil permease
VLEIPAEYTSKSLRASVISPPILLGGSGGANFGDDLYQYLVSTSLIVSGLLSVVQMFRFHIKGTKYYIGTGLLSVVGRSFPSVHQKAPLLRLIGSNRYIFLNNHSRSRRLLPDV